MVRMNPFAGWEQRLRHRDQTHGQSRGKKRVGQTERIALKHIHYPKKAMATHFCTLAGKIPWTEQPGRLQSMGLLRVRHDWASSLSCIGEGNGNPLQCSCLGNPSDGRVSWAVSMGPQSRTRLERLSRAAHTLPCVEQTANGKLLCSTSAQLGARWQPRRGGTGWEVGRRFKREGTCVYLWLTDVDVWQKPTQHCKAIIFQWKINF